MAHRLADLLGDRTADVLRDLYYEAGWAGVAAGRSQLRTAARKMVTKSEVDWEGWEPGNPAAAAKLIGTMDAPGLKNLLDGANVTINGIQQTRYDELAGILARSVGAGLGVDDTAQMIEDYFGKGMDWAEVVARTETARAVTAGTLDSYREAGLEQVEWLTADGGCEICGEYEDMGPVPMEDGFGDVEGPPAHPNCLCTLIPVLPEGADVVVEEPQDEAPEGEEIIVPEAEGQPDSARPTWMTDDKEWEMYRQLITTDQMDAYHTGVLTGSSKEEAFRAALQIKPQTFEMPAIEKLSVREFDEKAQQIEMDHWKYVGQREKGSPYGYAIQKATGYDAMPMIGTKAQIDELVADKGWTEAFRGVTTIGDTTAKDMYEQFKTGDFYSGRGIYGNGTYAAKDYFVSEGIYANGPDAISRGEGAVWRMAISPEAKVVRFSDLETQMKNDPIWGSGSNEVQKLIIDPGYYAMRSGYDVIIADHQGSEYYVILNRGAVAVQNTLGR